MSVRSFISRILASALVFATTSASALTTNVGPTGFAAAFSGAQTYTFENQLPGNTSGVPGGGAPVEIAPGINWSATTDAAIYGKTSSSSFGNNGIWNPSDNPPELGSQPPETVPASLDLPAVQAFIGYLGPDERLNGETVDLEEDYMSIKFDSGVFGVGAYLNFFEDVDPSDFPPTLIVLGRSQFGEVILGTYNIRQDYLDYLDNLADNPTGPNALNIGFYFGITSDEANIEEIRFSGDYLSAARLYVLNSVPEPQGLALMLTALGIMGATLRRRAARR